jgi:hypothetical protein
MLNIICVLFGLCYLITATLVTLALSPDPWAIMIGGAGLGIGSMLIKRSAQLRRVELLLFVLSLGLQLAVLTAPRA